MLIYTPRGTRTRSIGRSLVPRGVLCQLPLVANGRRGETLNIIKFACHPPLLKRDNARHCPFSRGRVRLHSRALNRRQHDWHSPAEIRDTELGSVSTLGVIEFLAKELGNTVAVADVRANYGMNKPRWVCHDHVRAAG